MTSNEKQFTVKAPQTRTHCCGHIVADTNVSPFARAGNICCGHKKVPDFVQKHFVSATNVSQFAQPKKHHGQQCVRNNVSSFARAFIREMLTAVANVQRGPDVIAVISARFSKFALVLFCYITNHLLTGPLGNSEFCFP